MFWKKSAPRVLFSIACHAVKTPLLELHGDRDEVVPFDQGKLVFAAAPQPRNLSRSLARATTIPIWSAATGILNN
jgi:fermentation-respiration switch protein FrsA (DUF1100 family)